MKILNLTVEEKPFLRQQLDALEERGHTADLVTVPGIRRVTENEIEPHTIFDYLRFYPMVLRQSLGSYNIIHSHFGLTAPFALMQPRRPVVLSLWGRDLSGKYGNITKWSARYADAVIVRNEEMAEQLDRSAHVVERGVDLEKFSPMNRSDACCEVSWEEEALHILFPYSPAREKKNYPLAEEVVERVDQEVDASVELHAVYNQPHEKIPVYMNAADVLLMTSRSEGSPNTVKEALACNLAVVSTDVGDVDQLLAEVGNSFVCDSSEGLVHAVETALKVDSQGGRRLMKDLTWDQTAEEILSIYQKCM